MFEFLDEQRVEGGVNRSLVLANPHGHRTVGAQFNQPEIAAAIKWAQLNPPDYSYVAFNERVTANGCAGYVVSLLGRRVLYFDRTAETHIESFSVRRFGRYLASMNVAEAIPG